MQTLPSENLLQHIWQSKYLLKYALETTDGEAISVLRPGYLNTGQGPDFFEARIKIGETLWAGNLEIHVKSSDWRKHKHSMDAAYQNIILHVVFLHDETVYDNAGNALPTLALINLIPESLLIQYEQLMKSKTTIPCQNQFKMPEKELVNILIERLIIERLNLKHELINVLLQKNNLHWEELLIQLLFQYAGMGLNNFPMEQLVRSIPFALIQKYRSDYISLLAIFAGVSGLNLDKFEPSITQRFMELKKLHDLGQIEKSLWKKKGNRPASFPERRIMQIVNLLHTQPQFLKQILQANDVFTLQKLIPSKSNSFLNGIIINVIIPVKFVYGRFEGKAGQEEMVIKLLESIKEEQNSVISLYKNLGIEIENAKESQAFLHLKKYYCNQKKCLSCLFVSHIFNYPKKFNLGY
jgi:hypothetical protein